MAHEVINPGNSRPGRALLERRIAADINANPGRAAAAVLNSLLQPEYRHALNELAEPIPPDSNPDDKCDEPCAADRPYGIGAHLRSTRLAAGLTQAQVARTLGRSAPLISAWENNERDPQTRDLIALNALYGCSVDSLLGLSPIDVVAAQATLNRVRMLTAPSLAALEKFA